MKGTKLRIISKRCALWFENLVSYERYKTSQRQGIGAVQFENLVSYERYKTKDPFSYF